MGEKTAGVGHFCIPTSPAIGTTVAQSASANTYTAAYVQLSAAAPAAIFITGIYVQLAAGASVPTYMSVQLATGAAAAEAIVGQHNMQFGPTSGVAATAWGVYKPIYPPIAVANAIRIAAKTASSVASALNWAITLECINQSNVVDDGVAVGTVTTVTNQLTAAAIATGVWQDATAGDFTTASSIGKALYVSNVVPGAAGGHFIAGTNAATTITTGLTTTFTGNLTGSVASVTGLTASNLDAAISTRMASYTQPTGFLAATFPTGTVANTTNITAGTITTATNLTNAPTAGDFTATMKTSIGTAVAASAVASVTGNVGGNVTGSVGSVTAAVSVTGDLSATMKTSVTTACTASTPTVAAVTGNVAGSVASVTAAVTLPSIPSNWITAAGINAAALNGKGDWLLSSGYTAPDNTGIGAIKTKTDKLTFTVANKLDVNLLVINGVTLVGDGSGTPFNV